MNNKLVSALAAACGMPLLLGSAVVGASTLTQPLALSDYQTSAGTVSISSTPTAFNTLPAIGTYTHGYDSAQSGISGQGSAGFYDDYLFTVTGARADSVTSTVDLGNLSITWLQERVLAYTPGTPLPAINDSSVPWSQTVTIPVPGTSGEYTAISPENLMPGNYVLEIRGTASGGGGGSYTGQLDLQPVPLPAGIVLLLSGLGLLGGMKRRFTALCPS